KPSAPDVRTKFGTAALRQLDGMLKRMAGTAGMPKASLLDTRFLDVDFPLPPDLHRRTVNLGGALDRYSAKFGVVFPTTIEVIVSPDGKRAIVNINEGWRGE